VSFVGQIRPLVKGREIVRRDPIPALLLVIGFSLSSFAVFWVVWMAGAIALRDAHAGSRLVWSAAAAFLAIFLLIDTGILRFGTPMWRRQTPKWFMYRYSDRVSALLWGVDSGLVVTTFRVTSLSWAALSLTFLGIAPWWAGVIYTAGFGVPQLVVNLVLPRRTGASRDVDPEPGWVMDGLMRWRQGAWRAGVATLAVGATAATLAALLGS
jgi:hypothetical protein